MLTNLQWLSNRIRRRRELSRRLQKEPDLTALGDNQHGPDLSGYFQSTSGTTPAFFSCARGSTAEGGPPDGGATARRKKVSW